jgi:hypothetical protein
MMVTDFTRLKVIASLPDPEAASPHSPTWNPEKSQLLSHISLLSPRVPWLHFFIILLTQLVLDCSKLVSRKSIGNPIVRVEMVDQLGQVSLRNWIVLGLEICNQIREKNWNVWESKHWIWHLGMVWEAGDPISLSTHGQDDW